MAPLCPRTGCCSPPSVLRWAGRWRRCLWRDKKWKSLLLKKPFSSWTNVQIKFTWIPFYSLKNVWNKQDVLMKRPLVAGYRIAQTPPSPFHVSRRDVGHKKALSVMIDSWGGRVQELVCPFFRALSHIKWKMFEILAGNYLHSCNSLDFIQCEFTSLKKGAIRSVGLLKIHSHGQPERFGLRD